MIELAKNVKVGDILSVWDKAYEDQVIVEVVGSFSGTTTSGEFVRISVRGKYGIYQMTHKPDDCLDLI